MFSKGYGEMKEWVLYNRLLSVAERLKAFQIRSIRKAKSTVDAIKLVIASAENAIHGKNGTSNIG